MGNTDAREARDSGIAQAAEHADEVSPRWTDRAYKALVEHAKQHTFFTVEQVRMAVAGTLPEPPTTRAWGSVVVRASRAGIITHAGHTEATDPAVHCNLVTLWRSLPDAQFEKERLERAENAAIVAFHGCATWSTENKIRAAARAAVKAVTP